MKKKTSIRFYNNKPIRSRFDEELNEWLVCAVDLVEATIITNNPRIYWYTVKRRNIELQKECKQIKMTARDDKVYNTDCLTNKGVELFLLIVPLKSRVNLKEWLNGNDNSLDNKSKLKAYELYENGLINIIEVGTIKGLIQIHSYIFGGLYDFAGKIRSKNISKGGFAFADYRFLENTLENIEKMAEDSFDKIIDKYIEMNIAHPFMEGNGRATRIWLDLILKKNLSLCVDWSKIEKEDYLNAMKESVYSSEKISNLIKKALTNDINNRELFMIGIDYSYYYEEV